MATNTMIDGRYHVPLDRLTQFDLDRIKHELTYDMPDVGYGAPGQVTAFEVGATHLALPKFYGRRRFGRADVDRQSDGTPIAATFEGDLKPVQREAIDAIMDQFTRCDDTAGALLCLPCGFGKTVTALALIARLKVSTLILVTKGFLADQWQGEVNKFLPGVTTGRIQRSVGDQTDVCIGMVQSLMSREYPPSLLEHFGLVICDECHHMAAQAFMRSLWVCPARRVLGLSATPERRDGTTALLFHMLGEVGFRRERSAQEEPVSVLLVDTRTRHSVQLRPGTRTVDMTKMVSRLIADASRNQLIASQIMRLVGGGRNILLLSDRIQHLNDIEATVNALYEGESKTPPKIGFYTGQTRRADRIWAEASAQVILSTFHMTKEGFNVPRLDTIILATPKGGDIEQCIGRIQRPSPLKQSPLVVDLVDSMPVFESMSFRRITFYRQHGYPVTREAGTKRQREDLPPQNLASLTENWWAKQSEG
eukprot:7376991-Prymnesium_polylepis.2